MSPAAMDPDATKKMPAVDERGMDPDATRQLPVVDDGGPEPGGDEVLTGEIVTRDAGSAPSTEIEPAAGAEGWLVDEALFPARPPITSHRRSPGITVPLILALVVIVAGAVAWVAVGHIGRGVAPVTLRSPRTVDLGGPADTATPSSGPSSVTSRSTAPPVTGGRAPRSSAPAASASPTTGTPSAASAPPTTAGAPLGPLTTTAPTLITTPADGMVVRVVSLVSGQSMSIAGNATNDGAPIVQSTATSTVEQWKLVGIFQGCYSLINVSTGKALDEPGGSGADGTPMQQWSYGIGNVHQIWCLRSVGDGQFSIQNISTRMLLDLRDGGAGGGVIQQWSGSSRRPGQNQVWELIAV